jgi:IS605 OrfB family transposase
LQQAVYEAFTAGSGISPVEQLCEDGHGLARQCGIRVDDEHGDLLPDVADAITRTVTAAIWFGITTGYLTLADGYCNPPQVPMPLAQAGARRTRGYATATERHAKTIRLKALKDRLARVQRRLDSGAGSVVRGGKALLRKRNNLAAGGLTEEQWRREWQSARLFLTADGEKGKAWGNETIRFNPDEGWLEIKLPAPLAHLANQSHGRYRLSRPVAFPYRGDEVAAQAATSPIRYDISHDPERGRWYIDASWTTAPAPAPSLDELRRHPVVAVEVNVGHLAAAVVAADGNILGVPATIGLDLAGLPSATRDGRLRAAISALIATAKEHGARAIVIEDLDFAEARAEGRERWGSRPSRGKRGRSFRRAVSGIPTGKLRDRLVQMASNAGLSVIVVDPAYTSR